MPEYKLEWHIETSKKEKNNFLLLEDKKTAKRKCVDVTEIQSSVKHDQ
jgi:hypothetical protein